MGRPKRAADAGLIYHVLNRSNRWMTIFDKDADYAAFEQVLQEAVDRSEMRLLAYCVLVNHWHLVVWPEEDGQLSRFTGWLTVTHTQRWHAQRHSTGTGQVYEGRFKSFPVQDDEYFLTVCRYAERKRAACQAGRASGGLAVGQPLSLEVRHGRREAVALGLAGGPCSRLGGARQWAAERGRAGSHRSGVCSVGAPSEMTSGRSEWSGDWAWKARSAREDGPRRA